MSLEAKISKLEALIKNTIHEGERAAAILARDRLLEKLKKKNKGSYRKHKHRYQHRHNEQGEDSSFYSYDFSSEKDFFSMDDFLEREINDTEDATRAQKNFIRGLMRGHLSCSDDFLSKLGKRQSARIIRFLIAKFGDPRGRS